MFAYGSLCLPQQTKNHIRTTNQPTALSWTLGCHYITYTATSSPAPTNHTLRHPPYHSTTGISNTHWTVYWSFPNYIGAAYTSAHNPIPPQYEPQPFAPKLHNLNTFLPTWLHVVHILDRFKQGHCNNCGTSEILVFHVTHPSNNLLICLTNNILNIRIDSLTTIEDCS